MRKFTIIILAGILFYTHSSQVYAQGADFRMLQSINGWAPGLKPLSVVLTESAIPIMLAVPVGIGSYGLFANEDEYLKDALYIGVASGLNLGLTELLKASFRRERPINTWPGQLDVYEYRTDYAMPSGHTSGVFATATALSLSYPKWYVIAPAYVWASSVGFSRMHLGLHYPSDVLAGAALGVGSAWLTWKLNQWLWTKYDLKDRRFIKK